VRRDLLENFPQTHAPFSAEFEQNIVFRLLAPDTVHSNDFNEPIEYGGAGPTARGLEIFGDVRAIVCVAAFQASSSWRTVSG
jgi:hypothetical protein